jgi:hypothetical protein
VQPIDEIVGPDIPDEAVEDGELTDVKMPSLSHPDGRR